MCFLSFINGLRLECVAILRYGYHISVPNYSPCAVSLRSSKRVIKCFCISSRLTRRGIVQEQQLTACEGHRGDQLSDTSPAPLDDMAPRPFSPLVWGGGSPILKGAHCPPQHLLYVKSQPIPLHSLTRFNPSGAWDTAVRFASCSHSLQISPTLRTFIHSLLQHSRGPGAFGLGRARRLHYPSSRRH